MTYYDIFTSKATDSMIFFTYSFFGMLPFIPEGMMYGNKN